MLLVLYGLDDLPRRDGVRWSAFRAAFPECSIVDDPVLGETHFILSHPAGNVRFYAPVTGRPDDLAWAVHFEYEDVIRVWDEGGALRHPLWDGLYRVICEAPMLLQVQPPGAGIPVAEAVLVSKADNVPRLPSWARDKDDLLVFTCASLDEFRQVIESGWALSDKFLARSKTRTGWADATARDDEALTAFTNYASGKRGPRVRYQWHGKPVRPDGSAGTFLDAYGTWVDWRDIDSSVVGYFAGLFKHPTIACEEAADGTLVISRDARRVELTIEQIGTDRYVPVRALNTLLAPDYEIRLVSRTLDGDTHCFLLAPAWLWQALEEACGDPLAKKIRPLAPSDGFG